ncbi:metallophosphoesterase family protein [Paenibacillus lemnae]|uniref:Phosphoesterase n=1 Tax=Paenibacillus lemnae TaxID=1330551 RepID=A0A848M880_PAELE|nr:metallophosphoesterase family protein [Paenibacillus lemnae]NMO96292.1 metallophosphoesterase [Paenibacillus lemnae]
MSQPFKIGVLSDTHMPRMAKKLPQVLIEGLAGCDLIIHAGDWVDWSVYEALSELAQVVGVSGNGDPEDMVDHFGLSKVIEIQGKIIGIVHGHGTRGSTVSRAIQTFEHLDRIDCIIFGHSHIPVLREENQILLFNPGSPTDKRKQDRYSFGILEIAEGKLSGKHIFYEDKH